MLRNTLYCSIRRRTFAIYIQAKTVNLDTKTCPGVQDLNDESKTLQETQNSHTARQFIGITSTNRVDYEDECYKDLPLIGSK